MFIAFPFDEIGSSSSFGSMVQDSFDFVFFFSIDKFRHGWFFVGPMDVGFYIRREKCCMEYVVYFP